jgi:hypothetical protein
MPRHFFDSHVMPNYHDWRASPLNERLAKNAVADANNMAARAFHHWRSLEPAKIYGAQKEGLYRDELAKRECQDFAILRDVAEAHKHFQLDRLTRRLIPTPLIDDRCGPFHRAEGFDPAGVAGNPLPSLADGIDDGVVVGPEAV